MTPFERAKACLVGLPLSPQQAHEYEERIASAILIAVMKERERIERAITPWLPPNVRGTVLARIWHGAEGRERGRG